MISTEFALLILEREVPLYCARYWKGTKANGFQPLEILYIGRQITVATQLWFSLDHFLLQNVTGFLLFLGDTRILNMSYEAAFYGSGSTCFSSCWRLPCQLSSRYMPLSDRSPWHTVSDSRDCTSIFTLSTKFNSYSYFTLEKKVSDLQKKLPQPPLIS